MQVLKILPGAAPWVLFILAGCLTFFVRAAWGLQLVFCIAAGAAAAACGIAAYLYGKRYIWRCCIAAAAFVCSIIWLAVQEDAALAAAVLAAAVWAPAELATGLRWGGAARRILCAVLAVLLLLAGGWCTADALSPVPYISLMQSPLFYHVQNSYEAAATAQKLTSRGHLCISDVPYADEFPNSFLDIYLSGAEEREESLPTVYYVHGGGFTWGDKAEGDPTGGANAGVALYFGELLDAGFNIVSVNYALAPAYGYPTPALQLAQATAFLRENGEEYGLTGTRAVYIGSSAGGNIAGQFVTAQCDADYAAQTGIPQVMPAEDICAVVYNCALLDGSQFASTGDLFFDYMLDHCGRAYFGEEYRKGGPSVGQTDLIGHLPANFPAAYITDGNRGTFTRQAQALAARLGDACRLNLYERSEALLGHGYELQDSAWARDNLAKTVEFLLEQACR